MYTGWWPSLRYRINRPLIDDEKESALHRDGHEHDNFDDRNGLIALNSTYIDWIDRRFRARGSGITFGSLLATVFFTTCAIFFFVRAIVFHANAIELWGSSSTACIGIFFGLFFYQARVRLDFFKKVYYPIRFNRKNRMIYVYRDKQDGDILAVPWDKVFFHIGRGMQEPIFCDIRGEVLEGETVKDTFALGPYMPGPDGVRQMWAFICRYMEGGPEAVGPDPLDRYISLSLNGTLKDCALVAYSNFGAPNMLIRIISLPLIAASTITRWLVFKSCSMPVWPAEIEASCSVDPSDPNIWPKPKYMNQFGVENPAIMARSLQRIKGSSSTLTDSMGSWQKESQRKK